MYIYIYIYIVHIYIQYLIKLVWAGVQSDSLMVDSYSQQGLREQLWVTCIHTFTHGCCQEQLAVLATGGFHWRTFGMFLSTLYIILQLLVVLVLRETRETKLNTGLKRNVRSFSRIWVDVVFFVGVYHDTVSLSQGSDSLMKDIADLRKQRQPSHAFFGFLRFDPDWLFQTYESWARAWKKSC